MASVVWGAWAGAASVCGTSRLVSPNPHSRGRPASSSTPFLVRCEQSETTSGAAEAPATSSPSATTSPFAGKKISTLLAARRQQQAKDQPKDSPAPGDDVTPSASAAAAAAPAAPKAQSLSPTIANLIKQSTPTTPASPFSSPPSRSSSVNAVPSTATKPVVSFGRKNIIDALKAEGSQATTTASGRKIGAPGAPENIFNDPVRTKEQIEAEKFRLEISRDQILLALSFFASSIIMMGMVYLVWKLGAIHYDEI